MWAVSDFILVYEEPLDAKKQQTDDSKQVTWRNKFMKNLRKAGLQTEEVRGEKERGERQRKREREGGRGVEREREEEREREWRESVRER